MVGRPTAKMIGPIGLCFGLFALLEDGEDAEVPGAGAGPRPVELVDSAAGGGDLRLRPAPYPLNLEADRGALATGETAT
jgi:hypothetical protein